MIVFLKVLFSVMLVWMCYTLINTSIHSNLFKEWDQLSGIPWMQAALHHLYASVIIIYLWICYKEKGIFARIIWLILLATLGSIAACVYILIQLFRLQPDDNLIPFFVQQNGK